MDHVIHNHVMGTRLADEGEARISATEGTKVLFVCSRHVVSGGIRRVFLL